MPIRTWNIVIVSILFIVCSALAGVSSEDAKKIVLPKPIAQGSLSLEEAFWKRHSSRAFSERVPDWKAIGQLLWAAQGINRPENQHRTTPSAFGAYPLEIYVVLPTGVFHYIPKDHAVVKVRPGNVWDEISKSVVATSTHQSRCVFVISAVFARTEKKASVDEAKRYIYLEGGHAAQNLLLQTIPLGMSAVPIGAPVSPDEQKILGIPKEEKPIYILATGYPK